MADGSGPLRIEIPETLLPLIQQRKRYKSIRGGRGSAKSHTIARALLALGLTRPLRVACCREIQKSIAQSVKQLFDDLIAKYGLQDFYTSYDNKIVSALGGIITFHGLQSHRADDIKSLEGADIVWIEEAQKVSKHSWVTLTPTVRKTGSEIWASWNPDVETDEVYQRTVVSPWVEPEDMLDIEINWRDNPWYNDVLESERRVLKRMNDDLYQHVWEGKLRTEAGLLFKRIWFRRYNPGEEPEHLTRYLSTDYATTAIDDPEVKTEPDWTELGVWGQDEDLELWALDWWSGQVEPDGKDGWIGHMARLCKKWQVERIFEEKGPIYRATKQAVARSLRSKGCMAIRHGIPSVNSKAERAMGFVALASDLVIHVPNTDWGNRLIDQLCAFTGEEGKVDDMVDACSVLARGLELTAKPDKPEPRKRAKIVPFTESHTFAVADDEDETMQEYGEV